MCTLYLFTPLLMYTKRHPITVLRLCYVLFHIRQTCFSTGADPGFLLGGGALVSCSTSTPINQIVFFRRMPVVLENRRSSRGGGRGCAPPAPSPLIRPCSKSAQLQRKNDFLDDTIILKKRKLTGKHF